jgi:hypothetical protein
MAEVILNVALAVLVVLAIIVVSAMIAKFIERSRRK